MTKGRRRLRAVGLAVGALVMILAIGIGIFLGPFLLRTDRIDPQPQGAFLSPFLLYVSPGAEARGAAGRPVRILIQPNNSGINSDDPAPHVRDAWGMTFGRRTVADQLEVALLIPAFPRPATEWRTYTHGLDRDVFTTRTAAYARLDLQLLAMIDEASARLRKRGWQVDDRVFLNGFSASGTFANRFTALHPERVHAVAAGAPGGWPIAPVAEVDGRALRYPVGVSDLEQLTGRPFDAAAYRRVRQLIYMGELDTNDSVDFNDGWDEEDRALIESVFGDTALRRWPVSERLYRSANASAEHRLVPGVGHERIAFRPMVIEFFKEVSRGLDEDAEDGHPQ